MKCSTNTIIPHTQFNKRTQKITLRVIVHRRHNHRTVQNIRQSLKTRRTSTGQSDWTHTVADKQKAKANYWEIPAESARLPNDGNKFCIIQHNSFPINIENNWSWQLGTNDFYGQSALRHTVTEAIFKTSCSHFTKWRHRTNECNANDMTHTSNIISASTTHILQNFVGCWQKQWTVWSPVFLKRCSENVALHVVCRDVGIEALMVDGLRPLQ